MGWRLIPAERYNRQPEDDEAVEVDWGHPALIDAHAVWSGRYLYLRSGLRVKGAPIKGTGDGMTGAVSSRFHVRELDTAYLSMLGIVHRTSNGQSYQAYFGFNQYVDASDCETCSFGEWSAANEIAMDCRRNSANTAWKGTATYPINGTAYYLSSYGGAAGAGGNNVFSINRTTGAHTRLNNDANDDWQGVAHALDTRRTISFHSCAFGVAWVGGSGDPPQDRASTLARDPWQVFVRPARMVWLSVAAAGGDITINGVVGNAVAAGVAFKLDQTISGVVGNAVAAGVSAKIDTSIAGVVGNAVAAGVSAKIDTSISGVVGNAVAAGVTADVQLGGATTINGVVGNAVAAGVSAKIDTSISGVIGNAVAAGVTGAVSLSSGITINGIVGNAVAAGLTANLTLEIVLTGVVANATAAGITATVAITLPDSLVATMAPVGRQLSTRERTIQAATRRRSNLSTRTR